MNCCQCGPKSFKEKSVYICLKIVRAFIQPPSFRGRLATGKGLAWPGSHRPVDGMMLLRGDIQIQSGTGSQREAAGATPGAEFWKQTAGTSWRNRRSFHVGDWKGSRHHLYLKGMKYQRGRGMSRYRCEPGGGRHGDESRTPFPKCQIRFQGRQALV